MKSVLITGITCYIGSEIARRLVADGVEVSGIVREGSQLQRLSPFQDQLTLFKTDGSQGSVDDAVSKSNADVIIHLAGFYTWEHSPEQVAELIDANITFGTKILEAAKKCGIKRLINTGSHIQYYESETANPANLYGATKQAFVDILDYYGQFEGFDVLSLIILEK